MASDLATNAFYTANAQAYDELNSAMHANLKRLADQFVLGLPARARVLDVGCGTGRDLAYFESCGLRCSGIDPAAAMLRVARKRTMASLFIANAESLPFDDAAFDGVWSIASLLHIPRSSMPNVLSEIRRVLQVDGIFVLSLKVGDGEGQEQSFTGEPLFYARYSEQELSELTDAAGFCLKSTDVAAGARDSWISLILRAK